MAALASGNRLLLADTPAARSTVAALPSDLGPAVAVNANWIEQPIGALLFDGDDRGANELQQRLAALEGPILQLLRPTPDYDLGRLVHERTLSINTAAAGGNASLMAMGA